MPMIQNRNSKYVTLYHTDNKLYQKLNSYFHRPSWWYQKIKKRGCKTIPTDTLPAGTFCTPSAYVGI